jgi:hypothetical protein
MLPPATYPRAQVAKALYDIIGECIAVLLSSDEFTKHAPKAKRIHMSVTNGNKDGFDQLDSFYRATIPFLGLTDFDPYKTIQLLIVTDGMQLETLHS